MQSICFKFANYKISASLNSGHENRQLVIETCNQHLGKAIKEAVQEIISCNPSNKNKDNTEKKELITVTSHSSMQNDLDAPKFSSEFDFFLASFLRRKLGLPNAQLAHHSLVFWQQNLSDVPAISDINRGQDCLEGFLYIREGIRSWSTQTKFGDWNHSYFLLRSLSHPKK